MAQREALGPPVGVAAHVKISGGSEAEAHHVGVGSELGFVVAVPAHRIASVAVEVGQHGVGSDSEFALEAVAQGLEFGAPSAALKRAVGIGVAHAGVALKKGESRFGNFAAKHANPPLGPVASGFERGEQGVSLGGAQPLPEVGERNHFHAEVIQSRVASKGRKAMPQLRALSLRYPPLLVAARTLSLVSWAVGPPRASIKASRRHASS